MPHEILDQIQEEQQAIQDTAMEDQYGFDLCDLEEIVKRWGIQAVLADLEEIHQRVTPDGSRMEWRLLSNAYLSGGYDDPNPCACDDLF